MLCGDREERPTAAAVKQRLGDLGLQMLTTSTIHCAACHDTFPSKNQLAKHLKVSGHRRPNGSGSKAQPVRLTGDNELRIRGAATAPTEYHLDENTTEPAADPSPCVVCLKKNFASAKRFYGHLHGAHHYRGPKYVQKRRAEIDTEFDAEHHEKRLEQWVRKDMEKH